MTIILQENKTKENHRNHLLDYFYSSLEDSEEKNISQFQYQYGHILY